jgi:hypothetical protein
VRVISCCVTYFVHEHSWENIGFDHHIMTSTDSWIKLNFEINILNIISLSGDWICNLCFHPENCDRVSYGAAIFSEIIMCNNYHSLYKHWAMMNIYGTEPRWFPGHNEYEQRANHEIVLGIPLKALIRFVFPFCILLFCMMSYCLSNCKVYFLFHMQ